MDGGRSASWTPFGGNDVRSDNFVKRVLFVFSGVWFVFHAFAVLVLVLGNGDWNAAGGPLVAALFFDVVIALVGGLIWLASKIWPGEWFD